jgi:hypothetical protein
MKTRCLGAIRYDARKIPLVKHQEVYMNIPMNTNMYQGKSSFLTAAVIFSFLMIGSVTAAMLPAASSTASTNCDLPKIDTYNEVGFISQVAGCTNPAQAAQPRH